MTVGMRLVSLLDEIVSEVTTRETKYRGLAVYLGAGKKVYIIS